MLYCTFSMIQYMQLQFRQVMWLHSNMYIAHRCQGLGIYYGTLFDDMSTLCFAIGLWFCDRGGTFWQHGGSATVMVYGSCNYNNKIVFCLKSTAHHQYSGVFLSQITSSAKTFASIFICRVGNKVRP